jgi:hypothetical protein
MNKFLHIFRKCVATVATAATFGSNTGSNTFPQGSNTVATQHGTLHWLLSRLKTFFFSRFGSNGSNTFPNFAQEIDYSGISAALAENESDRFPDSYDLGDEFDHEDYDEWEADYLEWGDGYGGFAWDAEDEEGEPLDPVEELRSWTRRAVDEAIEEENNGTLGDIPF